MDGGPVRVSELSRVRPGTDESDLIAVVVYPLEIDKIGGATAIALVVDLQGNPVWVNPANEGRSTAMFAAAAMACAIAQADQQAAYEPPAYEIRPVKQRDRVEVMKDPIYDGHEGTVVRVPGGSSQVGVALDGEGQTIWIDAEKLRPI